MLALVVRIAHLIPDSELGFNVESFFCFDSLQKTIVLEIFEVFYVANVFGLFKEGMRLSESLSSLQ